MKKRCVYDLETAKYLYQVGNRFDSLQFICGVILDLDHPTTGLFSTPQKMFDVLNGYDEIYGFNNKEFDNAVLAGEISEWVDLSTLWEEKTKFGKYSDFTWSEIPYDYLQWMVRENHSYARIAKTCLAYRDKKIKMEDTNQAALLKLELDKKSIDLYELINQKTGFKYSCSLNEVCQLTIGKGKTEGISNEDIPKLFKQGEMQKILDYQVQDGDITKELFWFIMKYGYCLINLTKKGMSYKELCLRVDLNELQKIIKGE